MSCAQTHFVKTKSLFKLLLNPNLHIFTLMFSNSKQLECKEKLVPYCHCVGTRILTIFAESARSSRPQGAKVLFWCTCQSNLAHVLSTAC